MGQYDLSMRDFEAKSEIAMKAGKRHVTMFEDEDGNWRGIMHKDEKTAQARDIGPETVLQLLLTHNGN